MRLMTWNCRGGGFRTKAERIAPFRPDVLAVQELSQPDIRAVVLAGESQPRFRGHLVDPANPRRGIGVFSYTGMVLTPIDLASPDYWFRRFHAEVDGRSFQVVATWPWDTRSRSTAYRHAIDGVRTHGEWIEQAPTVLMGDLNGNASYRGGVWLEFLDLLKPLGLVGAYHEYFGEEFGSESRPTHFLSRKETSSFHLDYCFVPRAWAPRIKSVEVGEYVDWHTISDHVPLIVDLDL